MKRRRQAAVLLTCVALAATVNIRAVRADQSSAVTTIHGQSNLGIPFAPYHEPVCNLDFDYPKEWHRDNADTGSLLKLAGTVHGKFAEFTMSQFASGSPSAVKSLMLPQLQQGFSKFERLAERKVRFGSQYQYSGDEVEMRFSMGENVMHSRMVFFSPAQFQVFSATFLCQEKDVADVQPFFDKILSTFHQTQTSHIKPASTASTAHQSWKLSSYTDKFGRITMSYPEGWKFVNTDPGRELDIKFEGSSPSGLPGGIHLSSIDKPINMSLEQFEEQAETTYLKILPSYAKQAAHRTVFGISRTDGLENSTTFSMDGHSARQANVFFADSKRYYFVSLTTLGWPEPEARELFQRVLSSVKLAE